MGSFLTHLPCLSFDLYLAAPLWLLNYSRGRNTECLTEVMMTLATAGGAWSGPGE